MKSRLIWIGIFLCGCGHFLTAQNTVTRDRIYKTSVRILSDPSFTCYGALYEVKDSSITISSRYLKHYNSGKVESVIFPVADLKVIHTNKPRNGLRGAKIGAITGAAFGMLFGAATANNTILGPAGSMAFFGSFGLVLGAPAGFAVGKITGHQRTPINGSMDEFNLNRDKLKDYAIKK